jgi:drug/metabolite transporter (DMT)-like permease
VCVVWGTTYLAIRIAIETLPPFSMSGVRWVIAGSILLVVLKFKGTPMLPVREWPRQVLLGTLLIGFGNGGVVWAEKWVPSGLASLFVTVTPFWLLGVERFTSRAEPLTRVRIAGFLIGFAGVALLVWPDLYADSGRGLLAGLIGTQAACFGWALGSNYSRARGSNGHLLVTSATQMVFGGIVMLIVAASLGERLVAEFSARSIAAFCYLIVVGSLIGFSAYTYALKHLPLSTVSLYAYINPVIAVVLGTIVLGEPITLRLVVASAVVLGGTALVRRA